MQPQWTDRSIRGPDADYLDGEEFRRLFGLPREWFDEKVRDGTIPPPIRVSARTVLYTWEHVVFVALWMKFHGQEPPVVDSGAVKPPKGTGKVGTD